MKEDILARDLMILASAGSGKTFQLGNRVIGLIGARNADPSRIVALTFTRKAAGEFADSVLSKLAAAAIDPSAGKVLQEQIGAAFDVGDVLERVVKALPTFQLGTLDSFFSRVVRAFQYELGLTRGTFELIEGPRMQAAMNDILTSVLGRALQEGTADEFLHAFRRATIGKEGQGVLGSIQSFLRRWHGWWKADGGRVGWGGENLFSGLPEIDEWESRKRALLGELRRDEENAPLLKLIDAFEEHTVGSGRVAKSASVLFERLMAQVPASGPISLPFNRKSIGLSPAQSNLWRETVRLLIRCELAAAVTRTKAVAELVKRLDDECEFQLRSRGLLGFDDVKVLMGRWAHHEDARAQRQVIDFRLDARYDHWLLDEFQDTSQAEWKGLLPLLSELRYKENPASLFVVGDRKQAIYGWRGGDVKLFDEVGTLQEAETPLVVRTMPESWRSCPAVLDLVNTVCGDIPVIRELFGDASADHWQWENHVSARTGVSGEARVEVVGKEEKPERLVSLLREIGVGERALTCGVLVRTNTQVQAIASLLREHGFDVIEEGRRRPVEDNPVGVALFHLLGWLADPADAFAEEVVRMSPLMASFEGRFPGGPSAIWEGLLAEAQADGFSSIASRLVQPFWSALSAFGRSRAGDVIGALAEFDKGKSSTPRDAVRWLADLEIPQSPGTAAVQVMTIHKSKGLGFDVVVLPEVDDDQLPDRGHFEVACGVHAGTGWLLEPPAWWVRDLIPELAAAEQAWADNQGYEALCVLYVALTRAKRGLYVFLPEVAASRSKRAEEWKSPANWIRRSAGPDFQSGDPGWYRGVPAREAKAAPPIASLLPGVPRLSPVRPSIDRNQVRGEGNPVVRHFGSEVHRLLEKLSWLDEGEFSVPGDAAGKAVEKLLGNLTAAGWLEKRGRSMQLFREQSFEALVDGRWISGVVDRLHVELDSDGRARSLEIVDFKTDRTSSTEEIFRNHRAQMEAYRKALGTLYPGVPIRCVILATGAGEAVEFPV